MTAYQSGTAGGAVSEGARVGRGAGSSSVRPSIGGENRRQRAPDVVDSEEAAACPENTPSLQQDVAVQAAIACSQVLVVVWQWNKTAGGLAVRIQPAAVLSMFIVGLLIMRCCSAFYMRNRRWVLPILRAAVFLVPSTRQVQVGTSLILERAAAAGAKGLVLDTLRVATSIRLLPVLCLGIFTPQMPASALATHAAITLLTWNSTGYCSTPLLSDPLSQHRQAQVAAMLQHASLPLAALQPLAAPLLQPATGEAPTTAAVCWATMSFLHLLLGLLLPTLMAVHSWPPPQHTPAAGSQGRASPASPLSRLSDAGAAADRLLWRVLGARSSPAVRAVICWYLLSNTWLLCKVWAGL